MPETPWQQQFQKLLARAGEEFKKTSEELKSEAQRLLVEVRDPANQKKVKEGLRDIGVWAKKAADQAAEVIDSAVKKAETTWKKDAPKKGAPAAAKPAAPRPSAEKASTEKAPAEKAAAEKPAAEKAPAQKAPAKKTVGKKKAAAAPAKAARPVTKPGAKSIGKKKPKAS
jgi:hypothetical protein